MVPSQTLTLGAFYLNRRGEVMGPILKNETPQQPLNGSKYPFKVDDYRLGEITYTAKGKHVFGSAGLDDLIVDSEGAVRRVIHTGEFYHTKAGKVVGPIMRTKGGDQAAGTFPFYYELEGYGKVYLTTDGAARNSSPSRNLDLSRQGSGPDAPEPPTGYEQANIKPGLFDGSFSNKKPSLKPKQVNPKVVKLPSPRRRVININPVRNTVEEEQGPKWKRLSVFEGVSVIVSLAEVQHIEKQRSLDGEPQGLIVVTGKTNWDHNSGGWMNPVFINKGESVDFLKQFDAYLTFLENPIVITKEKPKKKGKDIGKASGVEFLSINAMLPEDGSFFDDIGFEEGLPDDMPF